nr:tyrosine-type recombinase/integrase [Actinomyces oris]
MATIEAYRTAKGEKRWRVRYRTPERRQTDKRGFRRKADAAAFAASVEVSKSMGAYVPASAGRVTVGDLSGPWLERRRGVVKPKTAVMDESAVRVHVLPRWGGVAVGDVRASAVQAWVSELVAGGAGSSTVQAAHGALRKILQDAVTDRQIVVNPAAGVRLPKVVRRRRTYLDVEQLARLAVCAGELGPVFLVLGWTGLRFGELAGLRVEDVDVLRRRLTVRRTVSEVAGRLVEGTPKTAQGIRSVPFPAFLAPVVGAQLAGKAPDREAFSSPLGGPLRGNYIRRRFLTPARALAGTAVERVQAAVGVVTSARGPVYGEATVAAVRAWQARHGLAATGAVDVATWEALEAAEGLEGPALVLEEGARDFGALTLHDLRHTAASLAISSGANVKAVQTMLGHRSAAMTLDVYADLFPDDLDAVAGALDALGSATTSEIVGNMWAIRPVAV